MLFKLELILINSNSYCNNYLKKLIDIYLKKFIYNYDNLLYKKDIDKNEYLIETSNEKDNKIDELIIIIEKHIKNLYPDCGNSWKLNYNFINFLYN
jgi:hypothetical protein